MDFKVERFAVDTRRRRNQYPIHQIKEIGDGFVIRKSQRPKGRLSGIGRHQGKRFSQTTLPNGDLRLVLVGWLPVVKRKKV